MQKIFRLKRINVHRAGLFIGSMGFALGVVLGTLLLVGFAKPEEITISCWFIKINPGRVMSLFVPVITAILGYLHGAFFAFAYNIIAQFHGGIEIQLEEHSLSNSQDS